ncbi:MAG TPA: NAD(P)-dependent oxidoreductase, partial [Bacillales bacterium]|nr:NAD(P)-dependent oxidoreductase [Bacillales bacterium]
MLVLTSAKIRRSLQKKMNETYTDVTFSFHESMKEAEPELPDAEILITYGDDLTETIVEKAKKLKWVMVISAGVENLPFETLKEKQILVTNARGIHKIPMAEYAIAMLIATVKNMKQWHKNERNHYWGDKSAAHMGEISGKTMAVLGAGAIGEEIARLAKAFNMKTLGLNRSGHKVDFFDETFSNEQINECVAEADFVVAILPHTNETEKMISRKQFQAMKDD